MPAPAAPPAVEASVLANLDARAREIFRRIVDSYLASGEPVGSRHLSRILDELESRPKVIAAVRRERVVGMIMLLTGAVAERAHRIDDGAGNETADDEFVGNLGHMCTAVRTG